MRIDAYEWNDDLSEMAYRAMSVAGESGKLQISNHSYGPACGWTSSSPPTWYGTWGARESDSFGCYETSAADLDRLCWNAPYYLPFLSSGNDRGDYHPAEGGLFNYYDGGWRQAHFNSAIHPYSDGWDNGGYDTITTRAVAKNVVTVGCVNDAVAAGRRSTANATMTSYSSWGPTDDGRVKPDLVANGSAVYSSYVYNNNSYAIMSGSSMSVASASGSAMLLTEYYGRLFQNADMRASTIKGLMIHTADDLGAVGPDYRNGWGLINIGAACEFLRRHAFYPELGRLREAALSSTKLSEAFSFTWTNAGAIKVTLCWTDPAGTPQTGLDNPGSSLVNDLDLRVVDPMGKTTFPYVLDPTHPANVAKSGDNVRDNVEQILIPNPPAGGEYVVTVKAKGPISGSEQHFSLLVDGPAEFARIEHVPLDNTTDETGPYNINADIWALDGLAAGSPTLLWNTNGTTVFNTNLMTLVTNRTYNAAIPGHSIGTAVYYCIAAVTTNGLVSTSPAGAPGTLHCFKVVNGISILVGGSPLAAGVVTPAYGTTYWPSGNVVKASAELVDTPVNGHRHRCKGWAGVGSVPAIGSGNSVSFRLNRLSALTWRWADQYELSQTSSVAGVIWTQAWWNATSAVSTVTARPTIVVNSTNYCFTEWRLDGTRVQDPIGVATNPVRGILMTSARTAVAGYLPERMDLDDDGQRDWWEVFYFGSTAAMPGEDTDGDGFSNLAEQNDGTNPRDADSVPEPPNITVDPPPDPMPRPGPWILSASITDNHA
ncbi:MAG: S8 family serine peptidase, partial [bacterium]